VDRELPLEDPIESRLLTRILRGVKDVQLAVEQNEPQAISENYESGLNRNMCLAIKSMLTTVPARYEFSANYNPVHTRPETRKEFSKSMTLPEDALPVLESAASHLSEEVDPEPEPIQMPVIVYALQREREDNRSVRVKWTHRGREFKANVLRIAGRQSSGLRRVRIRLYGQVSRDSGRRSSEITRQRCLACVFVEGAVCNPARFLPACGGRGRFSPRCPPLWPSRQRGGERHSKPP